MGSSTSRNERDGPHQHRPNGDADRLDAPLGETRPSGVMWPGGGFEANQWSPAGEVLAVGRLAGALTRRSRWRHSGDRSDFQMIVDPDRHLYRLRSKSIAKPAILLSAAAVFLFIGLSLMIGSDGSVAVGGPITGIGGLFSVWFVWSRLMPPQVTAHDGLLVSRGAFGRHRSARTSDVEDITVRVRSFGIGNVWSEVTVPYVTLHSGGGFWLHGLAGRPASQPLDPAQSEIIDRLRVALSSGPIKSNKGRTAH